MRKSLGIKCQARMQNQPNTVKTDNSNIIIHSEAHTYGCGCGGGRDVGEGQLAKYVHGMPVIMSP